MKHLVFFLLFALGSIEASNYYETQNISAKLYNRPVMPGHSIIQFSRPITRLKDLSKQEISELFYALQTIEKKIMGVYKNCGYYFFFQEEFGGCNPLVFHFIPRQAGDINTGQEFILRLGMLNNLPKMSEKLREKRTLLLKKHPDKRHYSSHHPPTIFSKKEKIRHQIVKENTHTFTMLNYKGVDRQVFKCKIPSHLLIVPHKQHTFLTDCSLQEFSDVILSLQQVALAYRKVYGKEVGGYFCIQRNFTLSEMSIPYHVHFHVCAFPRVNHPYPTTFPLLRTSLSKMYPFLTRRQISKASKIWRKAL